MKSAHVLLALLTALSLGTAPLHAQTAFDGSTANINPDPKKCCEDLVMFVDDGIGNKTASASIQGGRMVTISVIKPVNSTSSDDTVSITGHVFGKPDMVIQPQILDVSSGSGSIQMMLPDDLLRYGGPFVFYAKCGDKLVICRYDDSNETCDSCTSDCGKVGSPLAGNGGGYSSGGGSGSLLGGWSSSGGDGDFVHVGFTAGIPSTDSFGGMSRGGFTFRSQAFANPGRAALVPIVPQEMTLTKDQGIPTSLQTGSATLDIGPADSILLAQDPNAFTVTHRDLGGNPFRTTTISFVNADSKLRLRMDTTFEGSTTRFEQTRPTPDTMVLEQGHVVSGILEALSRETVTHDNSTTGVRIVRRIVEQRPTASASWNVVSDTKTTWQVQTYGWVRTQEIMDPDGAALTSTWSYYQPGDITGPGGSTEGLGRVKQHVRHDGYESFYTYGVNEWSVATPYAGNSTGKVVTTSWNPGTKTETVTTTANGQILSKTSSILTSTTKSDVVHTSATGSLSTVTTYTPSGQDFGGKPARVISPDGTITTYAYTRNAGGGFTTVTESGSTTNGTTVTKGTRSISTTNSRGTTILSKNEAIGYSTGSALFGSMAVISIDNLGRALVTAYHPASATVTGEVASATSPAWTTSTEYNCCGVAKETDRTGIPTFHAYDGLQRQTKTNRLGVTSETVRNGLTTETHRYPETVTASLSPAFAGTPATLVSKSISNLTGTLEESWSPDPTSSTPGALVKSSSTVTTYQPAAGLSTRTVSTTPDNFTQTTDSLLDGRTAATYGDLSPAMQYSYSVNATGEVTTQSYVDGTTLRETTTSQRDWVGRTLSTTLMDGATSTMTYNSIGQLMKSTDPDGVTSLSAYNAEGERVLSATDLNNNGTIDYGIDTVSYSETEPALDGSNPVMRSFSKVWQPGDTNPAAGTIVSTSTRSPNGLSGSSQAIGVANPSTSLTTLSGNGNWTTTSTAPDGTKQLQTYTAGRLISSSSLNTENLTLANSSYIYDGFNRPITQTDSRTGPTTTTYLSTTSDTVTSVTDPGNRATAFTYDIRGRQITVDAPDTLDSNGATLANITTTTYFPNGQISDVTGGQTYHVSHTYDYADRQASMTTYGSSNATTTWIYDTSRGWLVEKNYAGETDDGVTDADYTYTAAGRLATRTWERGVTTSYGYDNGGRLTTTGYSDNTPGVTITYDALGRQLTQSNGLATSTYSYNPATLAPLSETIAYDLDPNTAGSDFTRVLDCSQDSLMRSTGYQLKTENLALETSSTYAYSPSTGRLETITTPASAFRYDYLPNSNLIQSITATAGAIHDVHNTWEPDRNVLASKQNKVGTTVISQYDYTVNPLGQRTDVSQTGTAFAAVRSIAWGYDPLGQVVKADSSVNADDRAFQYDGIGNRLKSADSLTLPTTNNYTPNALNQYTAIDALTPSYDDDGNMTSGPLPANVNANSTLIWDGENRLIEAQVNGGGTVTYGYDSQSRRIAETIGSATTLYAYDGWNPIAEYGITYALTKTYTWGLDLSGSLQGAGGVGGLLSVTDGTGTYFPTYDGNGNVSEYLDATGNVVAHYEYDPFGKTTVATGSKANDFAHRFSTKPLDATTGLYYYGYRYYDPTTGRWPSRDPIEEEGGMNLYGFVGNDAVGQIDLFGLSWSDIGIGIWTALGYVVPGSEFPTAALAAPNCAKIMVLQAFKNACVKCFLDPPDSGCKICADYNKILEKFATE